MKPINQSKRSNAASNLAGAHKLSQVFSFVLKSAACLVMIYLACSCSPCYYAPSAQNVPLFQEKKEANLSGSFQTGSYTLGCDIQSSVAVTDHLGITASYSHYEGKGDLMEDDNEDWASPSKGNMWEFGMGYYLPIKKDGVFETYAGYGTCKTTTDYGEWNYGSSKVHSSSFFIQPAIGMHKKHVELAFSTRFRVLNFDNIQVSTYHNNGPIYDLDQLIDHPISCLMEPAFTARFGGENVKIQTQVMISRPLGKSQFFDYDPFNFNVGLIFCFHSKKENVPSQ